MKEALYGRHAVEESLLANRRKIFNVFIAEGSKLPAQAVLDRLARERKVPVKTVPRQQLDRMIGKVNHQGVVAEVSPYPYCDIEELSNFAEGSDKPIVLFLDRLQDPQNVAALMRSAEAVGIAGVVLPRNRSAGITPAVVNASAGAVEYLKVALVTNLVRTMKQFKENGFWFAGLEDHPDAQRYDQADFDTPLGLVVGSEGQGLGRLVMDTCDYLVKIPMYGHVSSLNASVAGSVVLYEAWRQRNAST